MVIEGSAVSDDLRPILNTTRSGGALLRRTAGFSLIELVIVVVIGTTLATAVGIGFYGKAVTRRRLDAAVARVEADIDLARRQAMQTSDAKTMTFSATGYAIAGVSHLDRASGDYAVNLAGDPYQAAIGSPDFGGDNKIIFSIYGTPDSGGQMVVSVGEYSKTVSLNSQTGRTASQ